MTDWFVAYNRSSDDLNSLIKATPVTGNETPSVSRLAARTEGKKKAPATERQPGLSSAPRAKETRYS